MCTSLVFTHHIPLARSLSLLPAPTVQIGLLPLVPSDRRGPVSAERVGHREKYFSIVHHHRRSRYFSLWVMGRMFRCRCRVNIVAQLHFSNARQVHVLVLNMLPQFKRRGIPILATPNEFAAREHAAPQRTLENSACNEGQECVKCSIRCVASCEGQWAL